LLKHARKGPAAFALAIEIATLVEERLRRRDDAIAAYRDAHRIDPSHPLPGAEIRRILLAKEDFRGLAEELVMMATTAPSAETRSQWLAEAADIYAERLDDIDRAAGLLVQARAASPEDVAIAERLERAYLRQGKAGDLMALLDTKPGKTQEDQLALGLLLSEERDAVRASKVLTELLAASPRHIPAQRALEHALFRTERFAELASILRLQAATYETKEARLGAVSELILVEDHRGIAPAADAPAAADLLRELSPDDILLHESILRKGIAPESKSDVERVLPSLLALASSTVDVHHAATFELVAALVLEQSSEAADPTTRTEALRHYRNALEGWPECLTAARGLRRLAERMGDADALTEASVALGSLEIDAAVRAERLVEAACAAGKQGALESEAAFLRRVLAEPPPPNDRPALLLDLGMAEASAGLAGWSEHLQEAIDAAPDADAAGGAAMVLGLALSRAQRFAEAVEALDRAAAALDPRDSELGLLLETAAVVAGMYDPVTTPSVALRRAALRDRAASDLAAPPELVAAASQISALMNEPAEVCAELATRALQAGGSAPSGANGRPWFLRNMVFAATLTLLWAERYAQVRPLLDASIAQARATGDSARLALGLANRGWLALRRGDLHAAEGDARTALAATGLPAPPIYRVINLGVLVRVLLEQGELDEAEETLASRDCEAETGFVTAAGLRIARGRLRVAQGRVAEGLDDFLEIGEGLTQAMVTCPSYLPWRSQAALAHLALGDHESAGRLAEEELELARAFGAPRALGVAMRAAGVVAGGERGELLLREAIDAFERGDASLERARALADLGAMVRRRNRRTEARQLLREALDTAHRAGARPLAQQAETELRATGARPRRVLLTGLDSLTASERRIAELASEGLTNREIAQSLFVTTRTVEGHLTSIFRKLQLDSRNELRATLAGRAPVPA